MTKPVKKSATKPRKPTYINLDPTNDPEKVCEAYRQIAIASKLASSLSHKRYFDEQGKNKKTFAASSKARLISEKTTKELRYQNNALAKKAIARRADLHQFFVSGGVKVNPIKRTERNIIRDDVNLLRTGGLDIVSITTSSSDLTDGDALSIWAIDKLKRIDGKVEGTNTKDSAAMVAILKPYFEAGCLFSMTNSLGSRYLIAAAITTMRKAGMTICSVKNAHKESVLRGWVLPTASNQLITTT